MKSCARAKFARPKCQLCRPYGRTAVHAHVKPVKAQKPALPLCQTHSMEAVHAGELDHDDDGQLLGERAEDEALAALQRQVLQERAALVLEHDQVEGAGDGVGAGGEDEGGAGGGEVQEGEAPVAGGDDDVVEEEPLLDVDAPQEPQLLLALLPNLLPPPPARTRSEALVQRWRELPGYWRAVLATVSAVALYVLLASIGSAAQSRLHLHELDNCVARRVASSNVFLAEIATAHVPSLVLVVPSEAHPSAAADVLRRAHELAKELCTVGVRVFAVSRVAEAGHGWAQRFGLRDEAEVQLFVGPPQRNEYHKTNYRRAVLPSAFGQRAKAGDAAGTLPSTRTIRDWVANTLSSQAELQAGVLLLHDRLFRRARVERSGKSTELEVVLFSQQRRVPLLYQTLAASFHGRAQFYVIPADCNGRAAAVGGPGEAPAAAAVAAQLSISCSLEGRCVVNDTAVQWGTRHSGTAAGGHSSTEHTCRLARAVLNPSSAPSPHLVLTVGGFAHEVRRLTSSVLADDSKGERRLEEEVERGLKLAQQQRAASVPLSSHSKPNGTTTPPHGAERAGFVRTDPTAALSAALAAGATVLQALWAPLTMGELLWRETIRFVEPSVSVEAATVVGALGAIISFTAIAAWARFAYERRCERLRNRANWHLLEEEARRAQERFHDALQRGPVGLRELADSVRRAGQRSAAQALVGMAVMLEAMEQDQPRHEQQQRRCAESDLPRSFVLSADAAAAAVAGAGGAEQEGHGCCAVCCGVLAPGHRAMRLFCKHTFHERCIRPWLLEHSNTCPCCRRVVQK